MNPKDDRPEVRQRLLDAGLKFFANRGFGNTKIRDISEEAGSNIAAINYYFGDKMGFYRAVRTYALKLCDEKTAHYRSMVETDPWKALYSHIDTMLSATFDHKLYQSNLLLMRELLGSNQSLRPQWDEEDERRHRQYMERISAMLGALLQEAATPKNISLLRYTYHSLCMFLPIQTFFEKTIRKDTANPFSVTDSLDQTGLRNYIYQTIKRTVEALRQQGDGMEPPDGIPKSGN